MIFFKGTAGYSVTGFEVKKIKVIRGMGVVEGIPGQDDSTYSKCFQIATYALERANLSATEIYKNTEIECGFILDVKTDAFIKAIKALTLRFVFQGIEYEIEEGLGFLTEEEELNFYRFMGYR